MIEKAKKYFNTLSKICVLEHITFESKTAFYYVELSLRNDDFKVLRNESFYNLSEFKKLNKNKLPVVLSVNGIELLNKINTNSIDSFSDEDFIVSQYDIEENSYFSTVRKDSLEETFSFLNTNNYLIMTVQVGAFNILKYSLALSVSSDYSLPHIFNKQDEVFIYDFKSDEQIFYSRIEIEQKEIETNFLSPIATGLDFLLRKQFQYDNELDLKNKEESLYLKLIKPSLITIVGLFILLLSINYFYQVYLSKKYEDSEIESKFLTSQKEKLERLQLEVNQKEKVFDEVGIYEGKRFAQYADIIASLVPKNIILNELLISPLEKKLKNNIPVEIAKDFIMVSGEVDDIETLNDFLMKIETNSLFKKAKITEFKQVKLSSEFSLEIEI